MVQTGGSMVPCVSLSGYAAVIGDPVACVTLGDGSALLLGAARSEAQPASATVTALGVGVVDLLDEFGGEWTMPYMSSYEPAVNDVVAVSWQTREGIVLGVRAAQQHGTVPPIPQPESGWGEQVFTATDAASWRGGKWRTDTDAVAQADWGGYGVNQGAWFYGGLPQQRIASGRITHAAIWLPRAQGGVYAPQTLGLWRHTSDQRPSGNVTRADGAYNITTPRVGESAWVEISLTLAQNIIDGGPGGIAVNGSDYVVLKGLRDDPMSGALSLQWRF